MIEDKLFYSAVDLEKHPIKNTKQVIKTKYYYVLQNYVFMYTKSVYAEARLGLYKEFLLQNSNDNPKLKKCEKTIVSCRFQPWRHKYKYWLMCDLALICCDIESCKQVIELMQAITTKKQIELLNELILYLETGNEIYNKEKFISCVDLIQQYWKNSCFRKTDEKKIVITANMSAGKSTLINAIIGNDLARTSQEVCTGNLCYFYNLPFDDGTIHFKGRSISFSSSADQYKKFEWDSEVALATHFLSSDSEKQRICLVDTPGVNSTIKKEHEKIAKKCILENSFDQLIYILNANKLGTDEEIAYLKWVYKNVLAEKVIFVLNKLDDFKKSEDSIASSINGVIQDLKTIGYENPEIYPISAYFAYLLKKELGNVMMTDDEIDELQLFKKKFQKPEYNLASFYDDKEYGEDYEGFLRRSGLYYLENKLYGGQL